MLRVEVERSPLERDTGVKEEGVKAEADPARKARAEAAKNFMI